MQISSQKIYDIKVNEDELKHIILSIFQRLNGWAQRKIDDYKDNMLSDQGPQHYITGYEEYCRFEKEFNIEFDLLKSLCGNWTINDIRSNHEAQKFLEYRESWIKEFIKIQNEYFKRNK